MNYLSYSSRYKFLVSLGVLMVASPFIFIYIYLNMLGSLSNYNINLENYNDKTKQLLLYKEDILLYFKNLNCLIILLFIVILIIGVHLIISNLKKWGEFDNQELDKLTIEIKQMNVQLEKSKKELGEMETVNRRLASINQISNYEKEQKIEKEILDTSSTLVTLNDDIMNIRNIEISLINKIKEDISKHFTVYSDFKLMNNFYVDALAISKSDKYNDRIYEVKYYKKSDKSLLEKACRMIRMISSEYKSSTNNEVEPHLLLVTTSEEFTNWFNLVNNSETYGVNVKVLIDDDIL